MPHTRHSNCEGYLRIALLFSVGLGTILLALTTSHGAAGAAIATELVVAPDGDDANPGTANKPLATLAGAKIAVKKRLEAGTREDITVLFRGGTYLLHSPVDFGLEDSARDGQTITYAAYPGETPVFTGGRRVTGWQKNGNVWTTTIDEARDGKWPLRRLYVNDTRRTLARTPNEGNFFRMIAGAWKKPHSAFKTAPGDIRDWPSLPDANVVGIVNWQSYTIPIAGFDPKTQVLSLAGRANTAFNPSLRYYVENLPEALDAPGEWHLDRKSGVLSYLPLPGEDMQKVEVVAPVTTKFLTISGDKQDGARVKGLAFRGLRFRHADYTLAPTGHSDGQAAHSVPGAVTFAFAENCVFEQGEIACIGTYAIEVAGGCKGIRIEQNELRDLGAGGVKVRAESSATTIHNNFIHDGGNVYYGGTPILVQNSGNNVITHNEICDFNWCGICVGWSWGFNPTQCHNNRIEYNYLHHLGRGMTTDIGGIYTLGISTGTVIRNNVIHHVWDCPEGYLAAGIYPDEGSSGLLIENNIVYQTAWGSLNVHYGRDNVIRNNIFAYGRSRQIVMGRSRSTSETGAWLNFTTSSMAFDRNIVLYERGDLFRRDTELTADHNVYWNTKGPVEFVDETDLAQWRGRDRDAHSIIADPRFVDPANGDFRLQSDSPALALGFKPIDVSTVGLVGDPAWVARPRAIQRAPVTIPERFNPNALSSIDDNFETSEIGAPPALGTVNGATEKAGIGVTDEAAADGKCSLKFQDAAGQTHWWNPHLVYYVDASDGVVRASFDVRPEKGLEKGATFSHEWRDWSTDPFIVGPSIGFEADGSLLANKQKLMTVPLGQWTNISIECAMGKRADGTYKLIVTQPGKPPQVFERLACSPRFKYITWFGFSSSATDAQVFYIDNLKYSHERKKEQ